jgi:hypothetical protein
VSTSLSISDGDIRDTVDRQLVVQTAIITENTAVAMRSVLAKTDITADEELRETAANDLNGLDDRSFGVVSGGTQSVLCTSLHGDTKEHNRAEALMNEGLEEGNQLVTAELVLAG